MKAKIIVFVSILQALVQAVVLPSTTVEFSTWSPISSTQSAIPTSISVISDLPHHLQEEILPYLDETSLVQLGSVSRELNTIAQETNKKSKLLWFAKNCEAELFFETTMNGYSILRNSFKEIDDSIDINDNLKRATSCLKAIVAHIDIIGNHINQLKIVLPSDSHSEGRFQQIDDYLTALESLLSLRLDINLITIDEMRFIGRSYYLNNGVEETLLSLVAGANVKSIEFNVEIKNDLTLQRFCETSNVSELYFLIDKNLPVEYLKLLRGLSHLKVNAPNVYRNTNYRMSELPDLRSVIASGQQIAVLLFEDNLIDSFEVSSGITPFTELLSTEHSLRVFGMTNSHNDANPDLAALSQVLERHKNSLQSFTIVANDQSYPVTTLTLNYNYRCLIIFFPPSFLAMKF